MAEAQSAAVVSVVPLALAAQLSQHLDTLIHPNLVETARCRSSTETYCHSVVAISKVLVFLSRITNGKES